MAMEVVTPAVTEAAVVMVAVNPIVAMVKKLIVLPGLLILIPAIAKPHTYGFKHA